MFISYIINLAFFLPVAYTARRVKKEMKQNIHGRLCYETAEDFRKVIHQCKDDVFLKSQEGDVFNLKSAMSEYIALGRLLSEQGDSLELFASNHEDEGLLLSFLAKLDEENEASK